MDLKKISDLIEISKYVGLRPEYIQGGGGNTSIKFDDKKMAIKASGFLLKDIKEKEGYAVLDHKKINEFIKNYEGSDIEKDGNHVMKETTPEVDGLQKLKPSVEAGFHSLLLKYVIHSHSAYANILCCAEEGKDTANKIFAQKNIKNLWLPYMNPGFELSRFMYKKVEEFKEKYNEFPKVIFMENHGLIVTDNSKEVCIRKNEEINKIIIEYFKLTKFPKIRLEENEENVFASKTEYVLDYIHKESVDYDFFSQKILYPDQIVYINNNQGSGKIELKANKKFLKYRCTEKEAIGIEETLLAYLYVIDNINKNNLTLQVMGEEAKAFIKNWDAEKHRKDLMGVK